MTVSAAERRFVRDRANDCCEYCRLPAHGGTAPFHVDHIIPRKHGGTDDADNLCLACYKCNAHKSHDLTGFDPETGKIEPLYHPRKQHWAVHFSLRADMHIEGRTSTGRTTVSVLQMNTEERVENRQLLAELGDYPCASE
jgi:hypothetical protein